MEFYREGFLNKAGKGVIQKHVHSWRPRYFVLDGLKLKYYKSKEVLPESMLGCIDVSEMESISVIKNEKNAFQITTKAKRTYYMSGRSEDEILGWIKCLEMAKAKYVEIQKKTSGEEPVPSSDDDIDLPPMDLTPPTKPPRSLIVSGTGFLNPPQSPKSYTSPNTPGSPNSKTSPSVKPVESAYQFVEFPSVDADQATKKPEQRKANQDDNLYADPTYDTINEKDVSKSKTSDPAANLYDTVDTRTTKTSPKKMSRASDPFPAATVPPPLPARLPSMSGEVDETVQENKATDVNETSQAKGSAFGLYEDIGSPTNPGSKNPQPQRKVFGVYGEIGSSHLNPPVKMDSESQNSQPKGNKIIGIYDEVGSPDTATTTKSASKNTKPQETNAFGLYDEIGMPNSATNSGSEISQPQGNGFGLYDEVVTQDLTTGFQQKEEKNTSLKLDPTHVYAKPQKSTSLKRDRSKRKLIPGLMDVGEVEIDMEEEAAGERETLLRGMTKPQGERFAIEELRDVLAQFDKEDNNNEHDREMLPDFDVNQSASAFELLRMFLQRYE